MAPRTRHPRLGHAVNVHEAKTHLSRLLERVGRGEEVIIGRAGRPIAKLVPYSGPTTRRVLGQAAGQIRVAADFETLPASVRRAMARSVFPRE